MTGSDSCWKLVHKSLSFPTQSCALSADQQQMSMKGTLYWMAPEMMQGKDVGRPADIWSLGCLVVEMFTAQAPWHDQLDKKLKNNMVRISEAFHLSATCREYSNSFTPVCSTGFGLLKNP